MKIFIALFALAAVAVASPLHKPVGTFEAELEAIIAAINHPSTDPATAILLQEQLNSVLAQLAPENISVGPVLVDPSEVVEVSPVEVVESPVIPVPVEVVESPVIPVPVEVAESPVAAAPAKPLVQVIINVNGGAVSADAVDIVAPGLVNPGPVRPEPEIIATPVIVVEQPEPEIIPAPVIVVEQPEPVIIPSPVIVVDQPVAAEPVVVAPIVIPEPVVVLPDILN